MKNAMVVGDIHLGARQGNSQVRKYILDTIQMLLDEARNKKCEQIIFLGDLFDRRKVTDNMDIKAALEIKHAIEKTNIPTIMLCGNHDTYFKTSLQPNMIDMIFKASECITTVTNSICTAGSQIFVPWMNPTNSEELKNSILERLANESKDTFDVFGHFEMVGFELSPGNIAKDGLDPDIFKKARNVISGHYHVKSQHGNVTYVGTPYCLTWGEFLSDHGYHILDLDTGSLKFYPIDNQMFAVMTYDDSEDGLQISCDGETITAPDPKWYEAKLTNKIVKVIIRNRKVTRRYNKFAQDIKNIPLIDLVFIDQTIVDTTNVTLSEEEIHMDTLNVFSDYVHDLEYDDQTKSEIIGEVSDLYKSANDMEI